MSLAVPRSFGRSRMGRIRAISSPSGIPLSTLAAFIVLHVPLAFFLKAFSAAATAYGLAVVGLGLFFLAKDRQAERVVYTAAYLVGLELLLRGAGARLFWEFGKYSVSLLLLLALLKYGKVGKASKLPVLFFALLVPSVFLLPEFDRGEIAFNVSGPFALAVSTTFFSAVSIRREQFHKLLLILLAPIVGLASLSAVSTLETDPSAMIAGSKAMTAGIGPNQVSTILGLGMVIAFLFLFVGGRQRWLRWLALVTLVWMAGQCMMSFSRGGFWAALGAIAVASFYLFRGRRSRGALLASVIVIVPVFHFLVFPALDNFSGGRLQKRFSNTYLTGRDKIMRADMVAFKENPWLGVGPGQAKSYHEITFGRASAHTEYTRLLAEHGGLGLLALLILYLMTFNRLRSDRPPLHKACTMAFTAWALLTLFHSAMRLAAPGFVFGLGAALLLFENEEPVPDKPVPQIRQPRQTLPSRTPYPAQPETS